MILYDSDGNRKEVEKKDLMRYAEMEKLSVSVERMMKKEGYPQFHVMLNNDYTIDVFDEKMIDVEEYDIKTDSIKLTGEKRDYICGFSIIINPVDKKICGTNYFSVTKDRYDKGDYGIRLNSGLVYVPSVYDQEHFPEMMECMDMFHEKLNREKDSFSTNKDFLLMMKPETREQYKALTDDEFFQLFGRDDDLKKFLREDMPLTVTQKASSNKVIQMNEKLSKDNIEIEEEEELEMA